jgi:hypothetical protein
MNVLKKYDPPIIITYKNYFSNNAMIKIFIQKSRENLKIYNKTHQFVEKIVSDILPNIQ